MSSIARKPWFNIRFEHDDEVQRFVEEHPDGAERGEVAAFFGLSNERIRNLEVSALRKMREAMGADAATQTPREETAERIRRLIALGMPMQDIVAAVGVSSGSVYRYRAIMKEEAA